LAALGVAELTLFIEDADSNINGFQIDGRTLSSDELNLATGNGVSESASIEFIILEGLLGSIDGGRVSGNSTSNPSSIVFVEVDADNLEDENDEVFNIIPPVAEDDSASTVKNTAVGIDVLDNDNVGIIDTFDTVTTFGGSVVLNGDELEYTPAIDFVGQDTFEYTIDNLGEPATATVTVDVTEILEPTPVEPTPVEPTPVEPTPVEPTPVEPTPVEPTPVEPTPVEPTPVEPTPIEPPLIERPSIEPPSVERPSIEPPLLSGDNVVNGNSAIFGQNDGIFGSNGDRFVKGSAGNDLLIGDGGSDIFVLEAFGGEDTIQEFEFGNDIIGLSDGITFDQITIGQGNDAAIIEFNGRAIGSVSGITPDQLDASKFAVI